MSARDDVKHMVAPTAADAPTAAEVQFRLDVAQTLADGANMSLTEALIVYDRYNGGADAGARTLDVGSVTMVALFDDPDRLNGVIKAVAQERQLTYLEALDWVLTRHEEAASWPGEARDAITLAHCLADSGTSIARVTRLVAEHEQARTLAASTGPAAGERTLDEQGRVKRPPTQDLDALLADPLAVRRDFRRARDLGLVNDDGMAEPKDSPEFEAFELEWRAAVNAGLDHVATLELVAKERRAKHRETSLAAADDRKVLVERATAERKQREHAAELLAEARKPIVVW